MACRNNCSSHGICVNGTTCVCEPGYSGIDDLATSNDCHVNTTLALAMHVLLVVASSGPLLVSAYYMVLTLRGPKRTGRRANPLKLILYVDIFLYSGILVGMFLARAIKPYSWDTLPQPVILLAMLRSAAIMSGVQVTNFLWMRLIPVQFSPPFVKRLQNLGSHHIHAIHLCCWLPFVVNGLLAWPGDVGVSRWHVHTIDMILVALYCVPASFLVWRASFLIYRLASQEAEAPSVFCCADPLWKHSSYVGQSKHLQQLTLKLRLSVFLIVFCASGAIAICAVMIPAEIGHVFRYHPEIWRVVMFLIGQVWHSGMLFLFKPKHKNQRVGPHSAGVMSAGGEARSAGRGSTSVGATASAAGSDTVHEAAEAASAWQQNHMKSGDEEQRRADAEGNEGDGATRVVEV